MPVVSCRPFLNGTEALKGLLQSERLLERSSCFEEASSRGWIVLRWWLMKQGFRQIYLPPPKLIPRSTFDVESSNAVLPADLLFLPHDRLRRGRKFALTVVDVASRLKVAEPLTSEESSEVLIASQTIYKQGPLRWPKIL